MSVIPRQRILYVYADRLQLDRIVLGHVGSTHPNVSPTVTFERIKGAMVLDAVDEAGRAAKLHKGMPLAEARALVPNIAAYAADPEADRRLLVALARTLERYTPLVALDSPDGVILDIAGCAHLFGGEEALAQAVRGLSARRGVHVVTAIADTLSVAWAMARYAGGGTVAQGEGASSVAHLPIASMRLAEETVAVMQRLGLKSVADVLAQPRSPLVQRFGPLLGRRIDQLRGLESEPISPLAPTSAHMFDRAFAEPVSHMPALEAGLKQLAERLTDGLRRQGQGTRKVHLRLFHADGAARHIAVGASEPLDQAERIIRLVMPRLNEACARIETESGIDVMRIAADEVERTVPHQPRLGEDGSAQSGLAMLIDTLSERLGDAAVHRLVPVDTHQPDQAMRKVPARQIHRSDLWINDGSPRQVANVPLRPLRVLEPPEPIRTIAGVPDGPPVRFQWRRVYYHVAAAEGPERIAPEWWRESAAETLDYFRVEDEGGRRFWLFRKGLYVTETHTPRWFLHGFF